MKLPKMLAASLCLGLYVTASAAAQDLFVYPSQGQSPEQQQRDEYECYNWGKQHSGFDTMAMPQASTPPPSQQSPQGGVIQGAARGAAVGAVAGAIAGDAGKGAAIGAATGGLMGGMRRNQQQQQQAQAQQQWQQQQAAQYQQNRDSYNRAFAACLQGRGYSVT